VKTVKEGVKVLVAYDGSEYSKRALREATDMAKRFNGSVTLLHVFWEPDVKELENTEIRDQPTLQLLDEVKSNLKSSGVNYEVRSERSEDPPHEILKIANDDKYDYIAMGSRGRGGAKAWLLGSVSSRVLAEARCPVIVVK
jgi:nucleotide-binding universal stress UspA family protein